MGVTSFEATNSIFNITNENNTFSITTLGHWNSELPEKIIAELNKLIVFRSENEIRKKGIISKNDYSLSSLGTFKIEIFEEIKNSKNNDLEDML